VLAGGLAIVVGGVAGAGLLVLVLIAWIVFVFFVLIKMCLGIQTVILERLSPLAAFRRSWRLTSGSFWRIFLFYLVIVVVSGILSGILNEVAELIVGAAPAITQSSIQVLISGVIDIFTSPFILILLTLVYYDIRIRREAFDIEMLAQSI
jgi:flagellar biosynthesis protein FlhB